MLIYPAIDLLGGRCVRLRQGDYAQTTIFSEDPAAVAREWVRQGAGRLHVVDLDGAKERRPINGDVIRRIVEAAGVPVQLGGGIRSAEHLQTVLLESLSRLQEKLQGELPGVPFLWDRHPGRPDSEAHRRLGGRAPQWF